MIKIDLTTLSGWNNVSPGTHEISVVAKANGYLDSAKSTAVSFTKANVPTGETWVLNEVPQWIGISSRDFSIQFTSNNQSFTLFRFNRSGVNQYDLQYNDVVVNGGTWNNSLNRPNWTGWTNEAYRTITFAKPPTGDLLAWLQANGTKQGGTTAHTLTWSDSTMVVTVNGNAATSPYTLANGDTIVLKRTSGYQSYNIITDTGTFDTDSTQSPLAVINSDIKLQNGNVDMSPSMDFGFTINYKNAHSGGNMQ